MQIIGNLYIALFCFVSIIRGDYKDKSAFIDRVAVIIMVGWVCTFIFFVLVWLICFGLLICSILDISLVLGLEISCLVVFEIKR